jgi:hypothetical protein
MMKGPVVWRRKGRRSRVRAGDLEKEGLEIWRRERGWRSGGGEEGDLEGECWRSGGGEASAQKGLRGKGL